MDRDTIEACAKVADNFAAAALTKLRQIPRGLDHAFEHARTKERAEHYKKVASAIRALCALSPSHGDGGGRASAVIDEIAHERARQVAIEGWSPEHDDGHRHGELAQAAACYALGRKEVRGIDSASMWPPNWSLKWWKPKDRRRDLIRAGALIVAELERLDRIPSPSSQGTETK